MIGELALAFILGVAFGYGLRAVVMWWQKGGKW